MQTPVGPIGVVGVLVAASAESWSVRRRDGSVAEVGLGTIEAARIVPPSAAQRATAAEVEQAAALGWRGLETARLGEWLLRAGAGFTGRANSAMAVGDPGMPLAAAVDAVQEWYAERRLPAKVAVAEGAAPDGLAEELAARGWAADEPTYVMTAEITHVVRAVPNINVAGGFENRIDPVSGFEFRLDDAPDGAWLAAYRAAAEPLPPAARDVLVNHPNVGFASLRSSETGEVAAVARAAVDGRWAGLAAVEVAPAFRRRGHGRLVSAAAVAWAGRRGARRTYLQVTAGNAPAIALYQQLNFTLHHDYRYYTDL